ncbi:MAP kinase-activated protein kinase 3 [Balamuthia mandrillaris]
MSTVNSELRISDNFGGGTTSSPSCPHFHPDFVRTFYAHNKPRQHTIKQTTISAPLSTLSELDVNEIVATAAVTPIDAIDDPIDVDIDIDTDDIDHNHNNLINDDTNMTVPQRMSTNDSVFGVANACLHHHNNEKNRHINNKKRSLLGNSSLSTSSPSRSIQVNGGAGGASASSSYPVIGGKYVLLPSILGKGASADVREGFHKERGTPVAIKVLSKEFLRQRSSAHNVFRNELKVLNELRGDGTSVGEAALVRNHIVRFYGSFEDEANHYLVFERKPSDLFKLMKKNRKGLPEDQAKYIFVQLVRALHFLHHDHKLAHRDIKMENILIDEETLEISLCDFGFATHFAPTTRRREWCGSPFTVAPEMLAGEPHHPAAVDIWAAGSVLYSILCGRFPFQAGDMEEVYALTRQGKVHPFPRGKVSRAARDAISRCLQVDMKKRITLQHLQQHPFVWIDEDDDDDYDEEDDGDESEESEEKDDNDSSM